MGSEGINVFVSGLFFVPGFVLQPLLTLATLVLFGYSSFLPAFALNPGCCFQSLPVASGPPAASRGGPVAPSLRAEGG